MKYILIVSDPARLDILGIKDYIASDNPYAATKVSTRIYKTLSTLESNPKIGGSMAKRFKVQTDYFFFAVSPYPYIVFYRLNAQTITIDRVLDGRRDYLGLLGLKNPADGN
jgi:plasmid stabilization system protein ParE